MSLKFNNNYFWIFMCLALSVGFSACKNQQKQAEEEAARLKAERTTQAKALLNEILADDGQMSRAEKEKKLMQAKALNSDDPEVQQLIAQVEQMLASEMVEEQVPDTPATPGDPSLEQEVAMLFESIASSGSASDANDLINESLGLFASEETPVLIIISQSGDLKDYDKPTTIGRYLNYLKDQGVSPNAVNRLVKDNNGRISELELIKKSQR